MTWFKFGCGEGSARSLKSPLHYNNTPMHYIEIFSGCRNGNFQMKNFDFSH